MFWLCEDGGFRELLVGFGGGTTEGVLISVAARRRGSFGVVTVGVMNGKEEGF